MSNFINDNPFMPWNDEPERDDPFKPWNNPMHSDDPFAPWNNPLATERDYDRYCDEKHIRERDR
jgi:hypothetical protein